MRYIFKLENDQKIYSCIRHGRGIKIITETYKKDSDVLLFLDFSEKTDEGFYETTERAMSEHQQCDTELIQFSYCGICGQLLEKPKTPDNIFEDFKKAIIGI